MEECFLLTSGKNATEFSVLFSQKVKVKLHSGRLEKRTSDQRVGLSELLCKYGYVISSKGLYEFD